LNNPLVFSRSAVACIYMWGLSHSGRLPMDWLFLRLQLSFHPASYSLICYQPCPKRYLVYLCWNCDFNEKTTGPEVLHFFHLSSLRPMTYMTINFSTLQRSPPPKTLPPYVFIHMPTWLLASKNPNCWEILINLFITNIKPK